MRSSKQRHNEGVSHRGIGLITLMFTRSLRLTFTFYPLSFYPGFFCLLSLCLPSSYIFSFYLWSPFLHFTALMGDMGNLECLLIPVCPRTARIAGTLISKGCTTQHGGSTGKYRNKKGPQPLGLKRPALLAPTSAVRCHSWGLDEVTSIGWHYWLRLAPSLYDSSAWLLERATFVRSSSFHPLP